MKRAILAIVIGILATGVACVALWFSKGLDTRPMDYTVALDRGLVYAVGLGGLLGSLVSGASAGAQVAFLDKDPRSNAALAAMVVGFFAKLLILAAGILVLQFVNPSWSPTGFGVTFFLSAALVSAIALSAVLRS